jgi:cation transport regulator ChaC
VNVWVFGYGSLIWRPDIDYIDRRQARVNGWVRRFWQGSHDHRGVPHAPGRVVTLIEQSGFCDGMAYLVDSHTVEETFEALDHREKNGYERIDLPIHLEDGNRIDGVVYVAPVNNHAYLGPAPLAEMARQIHASAGPSGHNADYLFDLAQALRDLDATDPHVFELELAVREMS